MFAASTLDVYRKVTGGGKPSVKTPASVTSTPVGSADGVKSTDLLRISGKLDISGALSELEYRADPGAVHRKRREEAKREADAIAGASSSLSGPAGRELSRFALPGKLNTGSFLQHSDSSVGEPLESPSRPKVAHFQLSPTGQLVLAEGRQQKTETLDVLKETAVLSANTTEAKVRQRAVLMRQQEAAMKHLSRRTDFASLSAKASGVTNLLFRNKLV
jgi:hypothetical protein